MPEKLTEAQARTITLRTGACVPPIHEQLGVSADLVAAHQKDADALVALRVGGVLTHAEAKRAEGRMFKQLCRTLQRAAEGEKP